MKKLFPALLFVSLCCTLADGFCSGFFRKEKKNKILPVFDGTELIDEFAKLDSLLTERVLSDNPYVNMFIVERLHKKESKKASKLKQAEECFLNLKLIANEEYCNRQGFDIIFQNFNAFGKGLTVYNLSKVGLNRIESVFFHYIKKNEAVCRHKLIEKVNYILKTIEEQDLRFVYRFADQYIERYIIPKVRGENFGRTEAEEMFKSVAKIHVVDHEYIRDTVAKVAVEQANGSSANVSKYNIFESHLFIPCQNFIKKLNLEVYGLARYWISFHKPINHEPMFYKTWARFKFCAYIATNKEKIVQTVVGTD